MQLRSLWGLFMVKVVSVCATTAAVAAAEVVKRVDPAPVVLAASQDWDGNDGSWSSFAIQVGTPPQTLKVFPSTSAYQTLVVLPEGCVDTDPTDCFNLRGGEFRTNESSTWHKNTAALDTDIYPLVVGTALGYDSKARMGSDTVTLGWTGAGGPSLKNQTVGGFAAKDSYLGLFGLAPRASNFTDFSDPIPSFMENLKNQGMIPSKSWAYTAGNQYRLNSVLGSLTLGGYDKNKFIPNDITWQFNAEDIRDLTVQIDSISTDSGSSTSLLPKSIPAFLDSSLPYIWLPLEACQLFEEAFNLTWNNQNELYLLSDSQHKALVAQNPNITFTIGNLTAGANIDITLPYAAFDLTAELPLANNTRYFPLKRGANSTQYVLGRTFFQEAYIIADYDRGNFSVSQVDWTPNPQQDIITILAPTSDSSSSNSTLGPGSGSEDAKSSSPPIGAIAGGAAGGIVLLIVASILIFIFCIKPRRRAAAAEAALAVQQSVPLHKPPTPPDPTKDKAEMDTQDAQHVHEMEGKKNQWVVEADGKTVLMHEMPAREEVAVEMLGVGNAAEMETSGNAAEMPGETRRWRRFSWMEEEEDEIQRSPPPRWSWVTTPGGQTPNTPKGDGETMPRVEDMSPSMKAQLARLPK